MTNIAFKDGKPLLRDGKVGVGQGCCCDQPGCSRCIRNGEWDCQYTTKETCEDCTRTYTCDEARQTECDGDCPEGFTPTGDKVRVQIQPTLWWCVGTAFGIATVGCGKILSVEIDEAIHFYSPPSGFANRGRIAPTVTATVSQAGGSASGAVLAVNLTQSTDSCDLPYWYISSISVVSPGSGYTIYEPEGNAEITIENAAGDTETGFGAWAAVSEVDEDGGIVGVYVNDYSKRYRESASAGAIMTAYTVDIGGGGTGAIVTPLINTNFSSETFGHITGFTVTDGGSGYVSLCERSVAVASCDECPPRTSPEYASCSTFVANDGKPCGTWTPGFPCVELPCCDSCLPECSVDINVVESTADYLKQSYGQDPENDLFIETIPWVDAFLESIAGFNCTMVWVYDTVVQTNATGEPCGSLNGVPQKAIRSWYRYRLFLIDCRTRSIREVTDEALSEELTYTICNYPGFPVPLCSGPPFCNDNANPGFLNAAPTLVCP